MKGLRAPLSPHEEAALRKIGFGSTDSLDPQHLRRLLNLELIDWSGHQWMLTTVGRLRYAVLVVDPERPTAA